MTTTHATKTHSTKTSHAVSPANEGEKTVKKTKQTHARSTATTSHEGETPMTATQADTTSTIAAPAAATAPTTPATTTKGGYLAACTALLEAVRRRLSADRSPHRLEQAAHGQRAQGERALHAPARRPGARARRQPRGGAAGGHRERLGGGGAARPAAEADRAPDDPREDADVHGAVVLLGRFVQALFRAQTAFEGRRRARGGPGARRAVLQPPPPAGREESPEDEEGQGGAR